MKKLIVGFYAAGVALGLVGLAGCQVLESATTSVVSGVKGMGLKSDIDKKCAAFEKSRDAVGLRNYLLELRKTDPKPEGWGDSVEGLIDSWLKKAAALASRCLSEELEKVCADYETKGDARGLKVYLQDFLASKKTAFGWNSSLEELVKTWMRKALTMGLKSEIEAKYQKFIDEKDVDGAGAYLLGLLSAEQKPDGWDDSIEKMVKSLLEGLKEEVVKCRCNEIWQDVRVALEKRDFAMARKLTSTAEPYADEALRLDILTYRVGLLNEVINPYQSDVIIDEMQRRFNSYKEAGQLDQAKAYLKTVQPIRDAFPSIEQKVSAIAPELKGLYWLDSRVDAYLQKHIAEMQRLMDARSVAGEYRDYGPVYKMVEEAVAEMKLYNPFSDKAAVQHMQAGVAGWEASMKNVRRVMTTAAANAAIESAKEALLK